MNPGRTDLWKKLLKTISMTHPDPECNKNQAKFLAECPQAKRRFHELFFKVGNATYRYHQLAREQNPTIQDWQDWLSGLEEPIKTTMQKMGFVKCQNILSFTRYINEKADIGLQEYLQQHIDAADLEEYKQIIK